MVDKDIGSFLGGALARIPETITAAAGNDGVEVTGPTIDLFTLIPSQGNRRFRSGTVFLIWKAVMADTKTLTIAANLEHDTDVNFGTTSDMAPAFASAVVLTVATATGLTKYGVTKFTVDLTQAKRYLRLQSTANLSASGTDTVDIAAILVLGNPDEVPAA